MKAAGELPLSLMANSKQVSRKVSSSTPQPAKLKPAAAQPAESLLEQALKPTLSSDGQFIPSRMKDVSSIFARHQTLLKSWSTRYLMLSLISTQRDSGVVQQLLDGVALDTIHEWLNRAVTMHQNRSVDADKHLSHLLQSMLGLPMTVDALKRTGIGKTVNRLTKTAHEAGVKAKAQDLLHQWRSATGSVKRDRLILLQLTCSLTAQPTLQHMRGRGAQSVVSRLCSRWSTPVPSSYLVILKHLMPEEGQPATIFTLHALPRGPDCM